MQPDSIKARAKRLAREGSVWHHRADMGVHGKNSSPFGEAFENECENRGTTRRAVLKVIGADGDKRATLRAWWRRYDTGKSRLPDSAIWFALLVDELGCSPLDLVMDELRSRPEFEHVAAKYAPQEKPPVEEVGAWWDTLSAKERKRVLGWIREEGLPAQTDERPGNDGDEGNDN